MCMLGAAPKNESKNTKLLRMLKSESIGADLIKPSFVDKNNFFDSLFKVLD